MKISTAKTAAGKMMSSFDKQLLMLLKRDLKVFRTVRAQSQKVA
ncbi:hypothetical protein [Hufsiella ginkgonis]|nr:hypothetical protein [Hufsiella ginkgonis]